MLENVLSGENVTQTTYSNAPFLKNSNGKKKVHTYLLNLEIHAYLLRL